MLRIQHLYFLKLSDRIVTLPTCFLSRPTFLFSSLSLLLLTFVCFGPSQSDMEGDNAMPVGLPRPLRRARALLLRVLDAMEVSLNQCTL